MQEIRSYLIDQTVNIQLYDETIPNIRNRIVYARNVKIYKRVDNTIRLFFMNQDQKSVTIQDKTITLHVFHPEDSSILISINAEIDLFNTGVAFVTITKESIEFVAAGLYTYAVEVVDGEGNDEIAYADDNYGMGGTIELIEGRFPFI